MKRRQVLQLLASGGICAPGIAGLPSLLLFDARPRLEPKLTTVQSPASGVLSLQISCDEALQKKYRCERSKVLYEGLWDFDHDGKFDGVETSGWRNLLAKLPDDYSGLIALDWENAQRRQQYIRDLGGLNGAAAQKSALAEALKLAEAVKEARPKAKLGFYNVPHCGRGYGMARDGREPWWLAQPETLKPLLQLCDAMMPSMYLPYRLGVDVSVETNDRRNRNMVDLCQRCGPGKLVLPYVQQIYRNNGESYDRSDIPPLEQYQHAVAFTKAGASGVIFWGSSRLAPAKETSLRALRLAVDGMAYSQSE
jgi:hypothetical protein